MMAAFVQQCLDAHNVKRKIHGVSIGGYLGDDFPCTVGVGGGGIVRKRPSSFDLIQVRRQITRCKCAGNVVPLSRINILMDMASPGIFERISLKKPGGGVKPPAPWICHCIYAMHSTPWDASVS